MRGHVKIFLWINPKNIFCNRTVCLVIDSTKPKTKKFNIRKLGTLSYIEVKANKDCVCEIITQKDWYKSLW